MRWKTESQTNVVDLMTGESLLFFVVSSTLRKCGIDNNLRLIEPK